MTNTVNEEENNLSRLGGFLCRVIVTRITRQTNSPLKVVEIVSPRIRKNTRVRNDRTSSSLRKLIIDYRFRFGNLDYIYMVATF